MRAGRVSVRRGLADGLLKIGSTAPAVNLFGGAEVDLSHLRSRYRFVLITPQTHVDQALGGYAAEAGATILRGIEATAIAQDPDGVTVTAGPKDDDDPAGRQVFHARYVVAADGAHSTARRLLNHDFPGRSVLSSGVLADVKLANGPAGRGLTLGNTADCFGFLVPYGRDDVGGSWFRSMTWDRGHQVDDSVPVGRDEIVTVLNRAMGRDVGVVDVGWHSRFHCDERQMPRYRAGRVFFAGDAAHVHSPMGGQGMNATEVPLAEGRLTEIQRRPGFVLIREYGRTAPEAAEAAGLQHAERTDPGPALLVRPDGYIAWAGSLRDDRNGGWAAAWGQWTGGPAAAGAHRRRSGVDR